MLTSELEVASQYSTFPSTIRMYDSVVSFNHDASIGYGGTPPYDPVGNLAYDFVWETVEKLGLGSSSNPLDDLINDGDTVLIKPNWVDFGPAVYTRPEVVRPLIDMAIAAGATVIYIGDGGVGVPGTDYVMNSANYTAMVSELDSLHPGIDIRAVNLNSLSSGWHWVYLGSDSSFAGSNIPQYEIGAGDGPLFVHTYYHQSDNQSVNPSGNATGWYALNDKVLDADVIINVPKLKTHQMMVATISIKNIVGCTLSSTFDEAGYMERIAHWPEPVEIDCFNNDIFWRAILDMNKILLYANKDGVLQPTQQRKYLSVVDGIQAMERSQHHIVGEGIPYDRHVMLAGVDPVSVDAVSCRIMGYDYSVISYIGNADSDTVHPIGTNDPENIVIIGDEVDSELNHVFTFSSFWAEDAGTLAITDFMPPTIHSIDRQDNTVTANISSGLVAYILYQMDGVEYIEKMSSGSDIYSATVPSSVSEYRILAQDEHFNTVWDTSSPEVNLPPSVDAGVDQEIILPADASLDGTVSDDGLPGGPLTITWSKVSGPGIVTFADSTVEDTTANFTESGTYLLRLSASDGELLNQDEVTITAIQGTGVTWDSYREGYPPSGTQDDLFVDFDTENTVYMYGTGFNGTYKVIYWNGNGDKALGEIFSDVSDALESQHTFTAGQDASGDWHVTVYTQSANPLSYSATDPNIIADDTSLAGGYAFNVAESAIPEFPTILAAIVALSLSAGIYIWMRRKVDPAPT
ncbi:DUF362 domain-containing protein [Chloroflexota bacterium]